MSAGYGAADVVHRISLDVAEGEIAVVLGANGAGKTTTLRAISGVLARSGVVQFDGRPMPTRPEDTVRVGLSMVPQGRGTLTELTVLENLLVGAAVRPRHEADADVEKWCGFFPVLGERREQKAGSLSGGEQQMLAIARALMARPRLVLLDEPSLGLAPIVVQRVFAALADINATDGTSMLIVEQNADLALRLARSAHVLEAGRLVASGAAADFLDDDRVRSAYLGGR
ncbi:ATP-binding cassette domain-containing protein [Modestobacter sp. I12A-02628]|uniref:ABC transporter ATP-binding protein n=2 Tax=Goekera deserti TaxID=2497753 RepID=A0A7K3WGA7_9ACTN|nr:ATP-binding cassette domain-containing protein [Goekera deserti]NDI47188.1 ATP-binding cassette domain-containing protein [Goekera deserti]NEL55412.1 ABC transporter ATP-binding protein [Goekera deserti]